MRRNGFRFTATGILALLGQVTSGLITQCNINACLEAVSLYHTVGCPASFETTVSHVPITVTIITTSTISTWQNSTATVTALSEATTSTTETTTELTSTTVTSTRTIETVFVETVTIPTTIVGISTTLSTITNTLTTTTDIVATADTTQYATVYARDTPVKRHGFLDEFIVGPICAAVKAKYVSQCQSRQAFLSACACFGVPTFTTTLPGITATSTQFITAITTDAHFATVNNTAIQTVTEILNLKETSTIVGIITQQGTAIDTITTSTSIVNYYFSTEVVSLTETNSATAVVTLSSATTITVDATATLSAGSCGNEGVQWALWANPYGDATQQSYDVFMPTYFKTLAPLASGITSIIGGFYSPGGSAMTIYGNNYIFSDQNFVLDHRFYLYATQTGTYTFDVSRVDDLGMLWLGTNAYSGWTRNNDLVDTQDNTQNGIYTYRLIVGQYLPVRLMFAQAQGAAALTFTITAPDGSHVLSSSTGYSKNILQFSCDGATALSFETWGNES